MTLHELLTGQEKINQDDLKKAFMPYSKAIEVDGFEKMALSILLNISNPKPHCQDWADIERAKNFFQEPKKLKDAFAEIPWFFTHNLKYPNSRVKDPRIITETHFQFDNPANLSFGWAHTAATYRHSIWLLNRFIWRNQEVSLVNLIQAKQVFWLALLEEFGLSRKQLQLLIDAIENQIPQSYFPQKVSHHSKQVQFFVDEKYLAITPVVNHAFQTEIQIASREAKAKLQFAKLELPRAVAIGNLYASLGGNLNLLHYPMKVSKNATQTLLISRKASGKYFDDKKLKEPSFLKLLERLISFDPLMSKKEKLRARKYQLRSLREQLAYWLIPLIELKDLLEADSNQSIELNNDYLAQEFLSIDRCELWQLQKDLNKRLHATLQSNKITDKFAYHPKLISTINSQLRQILKRLSKNIEIAEIPQEDTKFIYLSSLKVHDLNAISCPYLVGAPSLVGIWGFIHKFEQQFKALVGDYIEMQFVSFSLFVRDERLTKTAKLTEPTKLAIKSVISKVKRTTIHQEYLADIEFDLIIKVKSAESIAEYKEQLKAALPLNFVGGSLFYPEIKKEIDWFNIVSNQDSLLNKIRTLPRYGRWLFPTKIQIKDLDAIKKQTQKDASIIPVTNGYFFLEAPKIREGAISTQHVYAENTLAIARKVNPIALRFSEPSEFIKNAFWHPETTQHSIIITKQGS